MAEFLKAEQLSATKWRVLAIPFTGEFKGGKDFDGEFFSPRTDIKPHWFKERPVLYDHGIDPYLEADEIGVEDELVQDKLGWWGNIQLFKSNRYHAEIETLLRRGKMYGSSGSAPQLVKLNPNGSGEILRWPHLEQTLTITPSNRLSHVSPVKALAHFKAAGIDLDDAAADLFISDPDDPIADLPEDLPDEGGELAAKYRALRGKAIQILEKPKLIL